MKLSCLHFISTLCYVNAYKVLLFFPFPIRSMGILGEGFVKHLTNAGHEVTYVTSVVTKRDYGKNFRQIDVSKNFAMMGDDPMMNITVVMTAGIEMNDRKMLQEFAYISADQTFKYDNVRNFLEDTSEKFDVVIADLYETEVYAGLSVLYDCPMIWSYSMGAHWQVLRLVDERLNPSYTSDYLSANMAPLSFQQRLQELWAQIEGSWAKSSHLQPKEEKLYEDIFRPLLNKRGRTLPDYQEVLYNSSFIFANEHHAFGTVPSIPLNFKLIGGFLIASGKFIYYLDEYNRDLQSLMDKSTNGVIYFSMGSTWQSKYIPKQVTEALLKTFSEFKQTVIWKYEAELANLPKNVHILKWAPQPSILAHPNCKIFISHGGQLSSTEAIHFGVATIGVPIFFDQFVNINKAVNKGYAIKVPLTFNLAEDLKVAIETILADPSYNRRAKELSAIYHDRPVSPAKELVHWVEHVVKTGGAMHLRSPSVYVKWYQKIYQDFVALVSAVVGLLAYVLKALTSNLKKAKKVKKN